jgi:F-type H+-transporting ATPase subunit delta
MTGALASHYARALADAVFAPNSGLSPQDAVKQLSAAVSLVLESRLLERSLLSPAVSRGQKAQVLGRFADELHLHRLIRNFLIVVVNHRRTRELKHIRNEFEAVVDERTGWVPAEITSANDLHDSQKQEIERALGTKLGKYIRAHYTVDPGLLAGIRARIAGVEYDASLRGKLDDLRETLDAAR